MKPSSSNSSAATARPPFSPAETLAEVPFVLYEIWELAANGKASEIVPLIKSVIKVTQLQPDGLAKLPQVEAPQPEIATA